MDCHKNNREQISAAFQCVLVQHDFMAQQVLRYVQHCTLPSDTHEQAKSVSLCTGQRHGHHSQMPENCHKACARMPVAPS